MRVRAAAAVVAAVAVTAGCTSESDGDSAPTPSPEQTPASSPEPTPQETQDPLAAYYSQSLAWEPCHDEFECTTLEVPLDYAEPEGRTIDIAVLRAGTAGDDRIGSLIVNPGGPGASGVEYVRTQQVASSDVQDRYDIVGFDPRGVGESAPVDCLSDTELDEFVAVVGNPETGGGINALVDQYDELAEGCATRSGDLLAHVGTDNVARDMDVLRAALGDEELYYLGRSYGTYIGARYADMFPDAVGRVVLDGAVDPSLSGNEFALGQARGIERALSAYLEWCTEQAECPLGDSESVARETLAELLEVIDSEPLPTDDDDRPLTRSLATFGIVLPLYFPPEQGYGPLTAALSEALAGRGSGLLSLADTYLARNNDGTYSGNQNEATYAVRCADQPDGADPDGVREVLDEFEEASPIFGPFLAWDELACDEWPVEPASKPGPVGAIGADPILVVGTTGDLATPYEWAESLAGQLSSGVLVTYEGFGHLAYLVAGNECVDEAVDGYLLDGTVPDDGLVCE